MSEQAPGVRRGGAKRHVITWPALGQSELDSIASKAFTETKGYTIDFHVNHRESSTSLHLRKTNKKPISQQELFHYGGRIASVLERREMRLGYDGLSCFVGFNKALESGDEFVRIIDPDFNWGVIELRNPDGSQIFESLPDIFFKKGPRSPQNIQRNLAESALTSFGPKLGPLVMPVAVMRLWPGETNLFPPPAT
jgi:hypothetical protein